MSDSRTIGRDSSNDVVIPNNDISSKHARVTSLGNDQFEVVDLDSLNGTFVNGYRILKVCISANDEFRISQNPGKVIDLTSLFNLQKKAPELIKTDESDFVEEFARLKEIYDNYQRNRIKINKNHQLKTSIIRAVFTFAPLVIFKIINSTLDPSEQGAFASNFIVFSVLGSTIGVAATGNMSPIEKISQLDEEFKVKYVCPNPNCRRPLGMVPWTNYFNQGLCGFCKAKYSK